LPETIFKASIARRVPPAAIKQVLSNKSESMPTVFIKDGFRFFFYSNDHTPIHVHVKRGSGEAVFLS
jgi:hypothetical protein